MKFPHFLTTPTRGVTIASAPAADGQTIPTDAGSILSIPEVRESINANIKKVKDHRKQKRASKETSKLEVVK